MKRDNNTPVNVAMFVLCVAMVAALILPKIARQRMAARQAACSVNLRQIGLAMHNYHSAFKQLPTVCGGTTGGDTDESCNQGRIGVLVGILPFIEQQQLWEKIINPYRNREARRQFPSMGPVPWYDPNVYQPWAQGPEVFRCPERAGNAVAKNPPKLVYSLKVEGDVGSALTTNYVANFGDGTHIAGLIPKRNDQNDSLHARATHRGMFTPGRATKFRDIMDGTANTMMMSETRASVKQKPGTRIAKNVRGLSDNPSLCFSAVKDANAQWWDFGRGSRWCDGALPITGFQAVLPPNSPSCTSDQGMFDAVASASSDHDGGVHVLFGDGHVSFISNSIDAGDTTVPGVHRDGAGQSAPDSISPYGLWGALGTRAGRETIDQDFNDLGPVGAAGRGPNHRDDDSDQSTIWGDKNGEVTLSAKFVRIIDKKTIELESASGTLHQVPLNSLRDKDIFRAVSLDLMKQ